MSFRHFAQAGALALAAFLLLGPAQADTPAAPIETLFTESGIKIVDQLAQNRRCPRGMQVCARGQWGPGGCYKAGYASCTAGRVCSSGLRACGPGAYGNGGCYRPGYARCSAGLICSSGMQVCARQGRRAYCYKPGYGRCR